MHPYSTQLLVDDHIATLRREADDNRLAATGRTETRSTARGGLRTLLGRVAFVGRLVRPGRTTTATAD